MTSALIELYEALGLINEHQSTTKSLINSLAARVVREWLTWVQKYMQTCKEEWLQGFNLQNKYQAMLGFCVLLAKENHDGKEWWQIASAHTFSGNYPILKDNIDIFIKPNEESNLLGIFHPTYADADKYIEIFARGIGDVLVVAYGKRNPFDDPNFQPQKFSNDAFVQIDAFLYRRQLTLSHELQHYLQDKRNWKVDELNQDYELAGKLQWTSPLSYFRYLTTSQEIDAELQASYNFYRHMRKRITLIDAISYIFIESTPKLDDSYFFRDNLVDNFSAFDGYIRGFVYLWVLFVYIPDYSKKEWLKAKVKEEMPRYRRALQREGFSTSKKLIKHNFDNIVNLAKTVSQTNDKYDYWKLFRKEYDNEDYNFPEEIFNLHRPNDEAIKKFEKLYLRWVDRRENYKLIKSNIDSYSVPIFPNKYQFLDEMTDKSHARRLLSHALNRYKSTKSNDFFECLYDVTVTSKNPYQLSPVTRIFHDVREYPIRVFLFYFVVFFYLTMNDVPEYTNLLNKTLPSHIKQMKERKIYRDATFIFEKIRHIHTTYNEFKDKSREEINKQFGNIKDSKHYFLEILFAKDNNE